MLLANENAIESGGYLISNSLRFQSASSQYLSRTPAGAGNTLTWTWSGWVKRGLLATEGTLIGAGVSSTGRTLIYIDSTDHLVVSAVDSSITRTLLVTNAVYRDPSAWYHVVVTYDETNGTSSNRVKLYVNGQQVTSFSTATYPPGSAGTYMNSANAHAIGRSPYTSASYFDGYIAETVMVDGQALTPSSFGTTDPTSGQWVAKKYTGTYGTNGFYLPFSNGTSTTTLGADSSGNGNNWTLTNFTRSAGVSDCWMVDVPSGNGYAGTQPSSNYAVLNPLSYNALGNGVTNSNLALYGSTGGSVSPFWRVNPSTIAVSTGKYYCEYTVGVINNGHSIGIGDPAISAARTVTYYEYDFWSQTYNGAAYGARATTGQVVGMAFDLVNNTIEFFINNVSQGQKTGLTAGTYAPYIAVGFNNTAQQYGNINFGQRSFAYTPPSGFKALCTANLPVATIKQGNKYMDATLYSGNSSTQTITNTGGFQPDLVWVKSRSAATDHKLTDSVRGATKALISDTTGAETTDTTGLTAFNSNGFTLGASTVYNNGTGPATYVGWQWQAGQGSTSSNTNGSITSTVSVNATAGFSVATFTTPASGTFTVGHGLGVAPSMIIMKSRSAAGTDWVVYHSALGNTKYVVLNTTVAAATAAIWNNTSPTSSVFSGNQALLGTSNYVAYCFAEIAGFSKFGSYTGNGSADGPFVYTGFRPKFVMYKRTDSAGSGWGINDSSRNPYNVVGQVLAADSSGAESTYDSFDFLSNGFKVRNTAAGLNPSGGTIIFMAFAESPFQNSNSR